MPIAPGEVIAGRFEVRARAGEGGMGTVYRAFDHLERSEVALKIVRVAGPNDLGRFAREAGLLAELTHPGIVRYIDHGTSEDGDPFLVMQWVEGETLGAVLARRGVSPDEAVELVRAVAAALAEAHRLGIVHRDIKPDNLIFPGGDLARPVLIDFGIARRTAQQRDITRTGLMVGTPGYMAPEQARGEIIDARADVFSLGCVLHECLTGVPAFAGATETAVWVKIILCEPRDLTLAGVDPPLAQLVARLLARAPADRFADAGEVASALAGLGAISPGERRRAPLALEAAATELLQVPACAILIGPGGGDLASLAAPLAEAGFRLAGLVDGSAAAVPLGRGAPADAAARLALEIADQLPDRIVAVAAGARAIDRAATLLAETALDRALDGGAAGLAVVDDDTAALLSVPVARVGNRHLLR